MKKRPVAADAITFLQLLIGEHDSGPGEHSWRKCRRCLAVHELENNQRLAVQMLETAIVALKGTETLDAITACLSGQSWSPDTVDAIAALILDTGRVIKDVE